MSSLADQIVARLLAQMPPIDLLRIVEMQEAARLSSLSPDQLKREYPDLIVNLSARRIGMRTCHALMLREVTDTAA